MLKQKHISERFNFEERRVAPTISTYRWQQISEHVLDSAEPKSDSFYSTGNVECKIHSNAEIFRPGRGGRMRLRLKRW